MLRLQLLSNLVAVHSGLDCTHLRRYYLPTGTSQSLDFICQCNLDPFLPFRVVRIICLFDFLEYFTKPLANLSRFLLPYAYVRKLSLFDDFYLSSMSMSVSSDNGSVASSHEDLHDHGSTPAVTGTGANTEAEHVGSDWSSIPDEIRSLIERDINKPLRVIGICRTLTENVSEPLLADSILLMKMLSEQTNLESQIWIYPSPVQEALQKWTSNDRIIHGPPDGERVQIQTGFVEECIRQGWLVHVEPEVGKQVALREVTKATEAMEKSCGNVLIVANAHGYDTEGEEDGEIVVNTLDVWSKESRISASELDSAIAAGRLGHHQYFARVTLLSSTCHAGRLASKTHEFSLVAASNTGDHSALDCSNSLRFRGTSFVHAVDKHLRNEFHPENGMRVSHLTGKPLENTLQRLMELAEPTEVHEPLIILAPYDALVSVPPGSNIPPRLSDRPTANAAEAPGNAATHQAATPDPFSGSESGLGRITLGAKIRYFEQSNPIKEKTMSYEIVRVSIARYRAGILSAEDTKLLNDHMDSIKWWNTRINELFIDVFGGAGVLPIEDSRAQLDRLEVFELLRGHKYLARLLPKHPLHAPTEARGAYDARQLAYIKAIVKAHGVSATKSWLRNQKYKFNELKARGTLFES
ncbi:hypothetical protein BJ508DRAFT_324835 [Ascobolus immersus RN42]|uniref:Uncharacterized protein n=1 Tax=Ascobolus immersus RN42 TaxID=1160509 RepID=A0A3N4INT0_ASCIM|nr:hypothetical protein BJ508DRAFT_324835 [Ascobolus immersus RN42]